MKVIAFDGSKYDLPATAEIRKEFDPRSGFEFEGRGHYPQCLVTTAYDVFAGLPVARSIATYHGSEREEARGLLPFIPKRSVLLFDRGYPSYEFIHHLRENHKKGYYLFRCPAESTFPAVEAFVRSGLSEDYISIAPSNNFLRGLSGKQRKRANCIQLRVIRLVSPDGTVSVLLTNLLNHGAFTKEQIVELYFRRWRIEDHYRSEKVVLEVERFHGKSPNSIRQELFGIVVMSVIARTLMAVASKLLGPKTAEFQFKNAVMKLAKEAAVLVPDDPDKAVAAFSHILREIRRVRYYRPKSPKPSQPRVTKRPVNKWSSGRKANVQNA
jgi:hypothetical protein